MVDGGWLTVDQHRAWLAENSRKKSTLYHPPSTIRKKGSPQGLPSHYPKSGTILLLRDRRLAARGAADLVGVQAARADLHLRDLPFVDHADDLEVGLPGAAGLVVRVRDIVAEGNSLLADVALIAGDGHGLVLHDLDARHVRTVALAMAGLQNARVPAGALGHLGTDFLEQLVGGRALMDVLPGLAARVQRARLGLGDELLDERPQFLGLRFGRFNRAALDERGREVAQERELLLAGP